jgi:uncharacterized repeat protein (TIGR01451 family)
MSGYTKTIGANCSGIIANGETKTCTITNDDIAPKLTVIKYLNPTTDTGKFNLLIDGVVKASNVGNNGTTGAVTLNAGLHTVSETAGTGTSLSKYVTVIGGDCAANGTITLAVGDVKTCTITNSLVEVDINKQISTSPLGPWSDSLSSVFVGTDLYYQFVVKNTGAVALQNVEVTDPVLGQLFYGDPTHVFCTYATLAVGEVKTCGPFGPTDAQYTGAGMPFENTATVDGCAVADPTKCDADSDTAEYTGLYWAFTPGFWKTHAYDDPTQPPSVDKYAWGWTEYHTYDLLGNVFDPTYLQDKPRGSNKTFAQYTLLQALSLKGGAGLSGAKGNLLRAATAALLNTSFHETLDTADHPAGVAVYDPVLGRDVLMSCDPINPSCTDPIVYYPYTEIGLINAVNAVLATGDLDEMLDLAAKLDSYNNGIHQVNWNWPVP